MSDEQYPPEPEESSPTPPEPAMPAEPAEPPAPVPGPMSQLGDFSTGEGLVALAGMIILAVWLIFEVIMERYGISHLGVVLAAAAVILPRINRDAVAAVHPLPVLMKVLGLGLALLGLSEIVEGLREGIFDHGGATIIGALLAYVGYVVAFIGARRITT